MCGGGGGGGRGMGGGGASNLKNTKKMIKVASTFGEQQLLGRINILKVN